MSEIRVVEEGVERGVRRRGVLDRVSRLWVRRSERTSVAVERAGCEREPQSGPELVEGSHGWPFCGDGVDVSEQGEPKAGHTEANTSRERRSQRANETDTRKQRESRTAKTGKTNETHTEPNTSRGRQSTPQVNYPPSHTSKVRLPGPKKGNRRKTKPRSEEQPGGIWHSSV